MLDEPFVFNGIDATTGDYLHPAMRAEQVGELARGGGREDEGEVGATGRSRGLRDGVAHVDRAWSCSFNSRVGPELDTYVGMLERLLGGHPIGSALEPFGARHAELSAELATELDVSARTGAAASLATLWTATNDARNFVRLGDPAVRLPATTPAG